MFDCQISSGSRDRKQAELQPDIISELPNGLRYAKKPLEQPKKTNHRKPTLKTVLSKCNLLPTALV
jgi:hypothetical protein